MAHLRKRHVTPHIKKLLSYSPLVGILGHRQVGKTTVVEDISACYVTMDTRTEIQSATLDPDGYVDQFSSFPVGLDECQLAPALFPALKDRVRRVKRHGQFLLTGSVRFTSRKAIKESLTGRIVNVELHPLMVSELLESVEPRVAGFLLDSAQVDLEKLAARFKISSRLSKQADKCLLSVQTTGNHLADGRVDDSTLWVATVVSQLRSLFDIPLAGPDGAIARLSQYRTRGGVYVPLVISRKDRSLGVIPILEAKPTAAELGSARSFLKAFEKSRVVFVTTSGDLRMVSANMISMPGGLLML